MTITSPVNPNLKFARRVREGREPGAMFIEGERLCSECLSSGIELLVAFHTADPGPRSVQILEQLENHGCPVYETSAEAFEVVSDTVNPQGIIVIAARPTARLADVLSLGNQLLVAFDGVQDPGNAGTIIRTAEAAGGTGVLALKGTVDCFAPKTLRSAMGSSFRLPIVMDVDARSLAEQCRESGISLVGTTSHSGLPYTNYDWTRPTAVVLGNEAGGVTPGLLAACDVNVMVPLHPPVESINVSAAAAAILFEAARRRFNKLST